MTVEKYRYEFSIRWVEGVPDPRAKDGYRRQNVGKVFSYNDEIEAHERRAYYANPNNDWLPTGAGELDVSDVRRVLVSVKDAA